MSQHDTRRNDRSYLFEVLEAQHESQNKSDFERLIARTKSRMEPEDVKLVLQEFSEWLAKKNQ
jgi:hypothetical protein